jgi:FkbM family methyltransferase
MGLMDSFEEQATLLDVGVYGFGPWYIRNDGYSLAHTWPIVVSDWISFFNAAIIEFVPNRSTVIQAGGWQGVYPFLLSNMFERVYTFEPEPVNFHILSKNCQRTNIIKFQAALSDEAGIATLELTDNTGQNRIAHDKHELFPLPIRNTLTIPKITIDSLNVRRRKL